MWRTHQLHLGYVDAPRSSIQNTLLSSYEVDRPGAADEHVHGRGGKDGEDPNARSLDQAAEHESQDACEQCAEAEPHHNAHGSKPLSRSHAPAPSRVSRLSFPSNCGY